MVSSLRSTSMILFGCCIAVISSACQSLGITLQRKSHTIEYEHSHHKKSRRNLWLVGFLMFIISNIVGSIIQISTLPLIVLSPLQSIGLIFNSILSCLLLPDEKFTRKLGFGTATIAVGAFVIASNCNTTPDEPTDNIKERFRIIVSNLTQRGFIIWFISTIGLITVLSSVNCFLSSEKVRISKACRSRHRRHERSLKKLCMLKGINFGIISGTLTAHTFLFAKSLVDAAVQTILFNAHDIKGFFDIQNATPYCLLLIMLAIIACQLTAFNYGLKEISTSILYPLCFLVFNVINLINEVNYDSLLSDKKMSIHGFILVIFGLFLVLVGVILISWDSAFGIDNDDDSENLKFNDRIILLKDFKLNASNYYVSYEQSMLLDSIGF